MDRINVTFKNLPRKQSWAEVSSILEMVGPANFIRSLGDSNDQHISIGKLDDKYHLLLINSLPLTEVASPQIFDFVDWFAGSPIRYIKVYNTNWAGDYYTIVYA